MQVVQIQDLEDSCSMKVVIDDSCSGVGIYTEDTDGDKCVMTMDKQLFKRFCLSASKLCKVKAVKVNHVGLVDTYSIKEGE